MSIKTNLSIIALAAALTNAGALIALEITPYIEHEIVSIYQQMEQKGRLAELSSKFVEVYNSLQASNRNCSEQLLKEIIKEARVHRVLLGGVDANAV